MGEAGGGGGERDVGHARPVGAQLDRALGLEERAQVRGLGLAAGPQNHGRHRVIRARPEQAVLLDERTQPLPVEADAVDVEARGPGLHRPDVVVDALEDAVHPLHDEVHLVLVDGRELDRQAVVGREPVLAHEAVGLQPPHEGGLVHQGVLGARADLGPGGEAERRARLDLIHPPPGADAVDDGPEEMVAGGLHRHPVLELDPEDRLLAVLLHRHHPGRPRTRLAAVVDFEADQMLGHDLADGQGTLGGRDQRVVGLAGVRLGALVGGAGPGQDPGVRVDVVVALGGPAEAVGVVKTRVEPLGRVGRRDLGGEHGAELVVEGACVRWSVEIAIFLAPVHPAARQPVEDLPGVPLASQDRPPLPVEQGLAVLGVLGNPGLAEVLLGQDVSRHPGPPGRHRDPFLAEDRRAVGVLDLRHSRFELDPRVGTLAFLGEPTGNSHELLLEPLLIHGCERHQTGKAGLRDASASGLGTGRHEHLFIYLVCA